jgi:hypothetical protein
MAEQLERGEQRKPDAGGALLKSVAEAAAAAAVAAAAKNAFSSGGSKSRGDGGAGGSAGLGGAALLALLSAGGWERIVEAFAPAAEDAAASAGTFVAEHAPDVIRDRIMPRFAEAFTAARGG